jgi:small subunit ribosomal protein S17
MELLPHEARRRTKTGTVVSDKMDKTVVVAVENLRRHRLYGRSMRRTKKYHAHDEDNRCKIGDKVIIAESRPLSRTKRWRVREIIGHDVVATLPKIDEVDTSTPPETAPAAQPPKPRRPRATPAEPPGIPEHGPYDEEQTT